MLRAPAVEEIAVSWRTRRRNGEAAGRGPIRRNYYGGPPRPARVDDPSAYVRQKNLMILGLVLLAGFLLPMIVMTPVGLDMVFPNLMVLGGGVAGHVILIAVYPAVAGVIVLLIARRSGPLRSAVLMGLGGVFLILLLASGRDGAERLILGSGDLPFLHLASLLIGLFALMGLFVGSRARYYCPDSQVAAIIGIIGGILYVVNLLLPVLPPEAGSVNLVLPFKMLAQGDMTFLSLGMLGMTGCLASASIFCIINVARRPDAQEIAERAFRLLVIAFVVLAGGIQLEIFKAAGGWGLLALIALVKFACWIGGLLLLVPVGATDLLVNLTYALAAPEEEAVEAAPPPPPPVAPADDVARRLARLKRLVEDGSITAEEFESRKAELLRRIVAEP